MEKSVSSKLDRHQLLSMHWPNVLNRDSEMRTNTRHRSIRKPLIAAAAALVTSISATADDLDVFDAVLASQNKPNILFVLDYSGSMKEDVNGANIANGDTTTLSKISILQTAVDTLLESNKGKVNVGIGSLYAHKASGVRWPISDLEDEASIYDSEIPAGVTVADVISTQLTRTEPGNATATVNALAEAAAYFRGDEVLHEDRPLNQPWGHKPDIWNNGEYKWGNKFAAMPSSYSPEDAYERDSANAAGNYGWCTDYVGGDQECEGRSTFECVTHPEVSGSWTATADGNGGRYNTPERNICKFHHPDNFTTPNYVSPLTQQCQANFIVLISDGEPTQLNDTVTLNTVLKDAGVPGGVLHQCEDLSTSIFGQAADTQTDGNCGPEILEYLATTDINPDIPDSSVKTYTVGFSLEGPGKEYLKLLAEKGDGEFYEASEPEELTEALNSVLDSILAGSQNFAELSIDVNPDTFGHDNRTYFSLFSPSGKSSWEGNLKGYFLDDTGLIDVNGNAATITDDAGLRFADTAQSFWSAAPDGNDVLAGGASESITELPDGPNARNIFTMTGGGQSMLVAGNRTLDGYFPTNPGAAAIDEAYNWLANAPMGDPLHTKPVVVNYGAQRVVYTMTNQGVLHAFDATTPTIPAADPVDLSGGNEIFAYMPTELIKNIPKLHEPTRDGDHVYGLDGTITRWHNDDNGDGKVNGADTIMLVLGMRRGGSSYYAIDVTNPNNPQLEWQISNTDIGFENMAQSWSRASLVSVNKNGSKERMLMFGGGYDAATLDGTTTATPANGNAIFMVDADGDLVFTVDGSDHGDMIYSIPSDLTIIDSDNNGMVDRAYFGDLGGQIWRVDFDNVAITGDITLTKFADLDNGDHQPLFYKPSISLNRERGKRFLAVSIGSGDRTQPMLASSENAFYMLRDTDVETGPPEAPFTTITPGLIYDATNNDIGSSNEVVADAARTELDAKRGWAVFLNTSEKSLSQVVTFEGKYLATTFEPDTPLTDGGIPDPCSFSMIGRMYVMSVFDARPIQIMSDGAESIGEEDASGRWLVLDEKMNIPGKVVVVHPGGENSDNSQVQFMQGKQSMGKVNKKIRTVFWHAQ